MASTLQTMRAGGTEHPETIMNFLASRIVTTSGVFDTDSDHFLVAESDTPAMSVQVNQGYAFLVNSDASMTYPVQLITENASLSISANSSGNTRIDAVVLYIDLGASPNSAITNVAKLVVVEGTPAGSPTAPSDGDIETEVGASNPYIRLADVTVENGETTILDADITDQRVDATYSTKVVAVGVDGWISYSTVIPTRSVSDDPTYEITFADVDLTSTLQAGMRMKFTQDETVRYFIITKVALDGSDTDVTLYGGTDYNVEDTTSYTISALSYSSVKAPFGFPLSPAKWTVSLTDTSNRNQVASAGTWYNMGSLSLDFPIGVWDVVFSGAITNATNNYSAIITFSTANNSQSDANYTAGNWYPAAAGQKVFFHRQHQITMTSKTTHYINMKSLQGGELYLYGGETYTILRLVCAYL